MNPCPDCESTGPEHIGDCPRGMRGGGAVSSPEKTDAEQLAEIERALDAWGDEIQTSLYWRLESERVRLLCTVPHSQAQAARDALAKAREEVTP